MKLVDYCISNKEWVFSGIGVTVIASIVGYFFNKKSGSTNSYKSSVEAGRDAKNFIVSGNDNNLKVQ